jgi:hypothetical protein
MEGHPAEPAQHQAVFDPAFQFFVAPLVQVFEDQQAQQHLHRGRVPPMHQRPAMPFAEIGPHLPVQLVIIEQSVQLFEHWIDLRRQLGHLREHIFSRVAIN